ncbi:hypothetical protein EON67_08675 [archaeon]|nr:MAG: hypothetical protein EON67_08675 [archaeon]
MSTEATVAPIRADFINRSLMGPGMLNVMKGAIWGNVVAVSQAVGTCAERRRDGFAARAHTRPCRAAPQRGRAAPSNADELL